MRWKKDWNTQGGGVEANALVVTAYLVNPNLSVQPGVCRALGCSMFRKWGAVGQVGATLVKDGGGPQHSLPGTSNSSGNKMLIKYCPSCCLPKSCEIPNGPDPLEQTQYVPVRI